jgi:hypothetical protein
MKGHNLIKGLSRVNRATASSRLTLPVANVPNIGTRHYSLVPNNNPSSPFGYTIRHYTKKATSRVDSKDIEMTALFPDNEEDFQIFKGTITNEGVVFTSSWIDEYFGITTLKEHCADFETQIKLLAKKGWKIDFVSEHDLLDYKQGKSPIQIALDNFFSKKENDDKLRIAYKKITSKASIGLGYYKFTDKSSGKFLGGGALIPIEEITESDSVKKVDIALHILYMKQGFGTACLNKLLNTAFKEHKVKQVIGSSVIQHLGTPTLCAKYGMIMENIGNKKYYFIDDEMWKTNTGKSVIVNSAADQYFSKKNENGDISR